MASSSFTFDFGVTATEFVSKPIPLQKEEAAEAAKALQLEEALAAAAKAEKKAAVAGAAFYAQHAELGQLRLQLKEYKKMEDDYERIGALQQQVDGLQAESRQASQTIANLTSDASKKDDEINAYEERLIKAHNELDTLRATLEKTRSDLAENVRAKEDVDENLQNAYADLKQQQAELAAAAKAKDAVDTKTKDLETQLASMQLELQKSEEKNEMIEEQLVALTDLEDQNTAMEIDQENMREQLEERTRTIMVKDERINQLEKQYQKALQGQLNAEAATAAVTSPTQEPPTFNVGGDSLASELADADVSDFGGSIYEPIEMSQIIEVAATVPSEPAVTPLSIDVTETASMTPEPPVAPRLSIHITEAASMIPVSPVAPLLSVDVVEAASVVPEPPVAPHLSIDVAEAASVTPQASIREQPELSKIIVIAETIPSSPTERGLSTAIPISDTPFTAPELNIHVAEAASVTPVAPKDTTVVSHPVTKKPFDSFTHFNSFLALLIAVLLGLSIHHLKLWNEVQAWRSANGISYWRGHDDYRRGGAYGNGRYIFNFIPAAMDIGNTWFSEQVAIKASKAITTIEHWAGIEPTPFF